MAADGAAPAPKGNSHPALFIVVIGLGFLVLFVLGIMTQIQTNEAFITHAGVVNVYRPNWSVLWQIPSLLFDQTSSSDGASIIFGWGIELIYLGFIIGFEILITSVNRSGQLMAKIFVVAAIGIVIFNFWTDYNYGTFGGGDGGHFLFAIVTSFIVGFFGTIGMFLIEYGWKRA